MGIIPFFSNAKKVTAVFDVDERTIRVGLLSRTAEGEALSFVHIESENIQSHSWEQQLSQILSELQKTYAVASALISFPPGVFRSHVFQYEFDRPTPNESIGSKEEQQLEKEIVRISREQSPEYFAQDFGIAKEDLAIVKIQIIEARVNGYPVSSLRDLRGKTVVLRALNTCLPVDYQKFFEQLKSTHKLDNIELIHWTEAIELFTNSQGADGIYMNIGNAKSNISVMYKKFLLGSYTIPHGEEDLMVALERVIHLQGETTHDYLHRYAKGEFSEQMRQRMHAIIVSARKKMSEAIQRKLERLNHVLPAQVVLMGEGSVLPEFAQMGEEPAFASLPLNGEPAVSILTPEQVSPGTEFSQKNNPLYTSLFLFAYAEQKKSS